MLIKLSIMFLSSAQKITYYVYEKCLFPPPYLVKNVSLLTVLDLIDV